METTIGHMLILLIKRIVIRHYIQQTMDGGYIISGTNSNLGLGLLDMIILKTDIME